jgi:hypothetical protein
VNRIAALLSRAQRSLQHDTGDQKFVYDGVEYFCLPNTFSRGTTLVSGGFEGTVDFTLFVNASDFPTSLTADMDTVSADETGYTADSDYPPPPSSGKKVIFPAPPLPGREYRVFKRNNPGAGAVFELILASPNR